MNAAVLKPAVLRRNWYRCRGCDMTEAEHQHRHGRSFCLVCTNAKLPTAKGSFAAVCVVCHRAKYRHLPYFDERTARWASVRGKSGAGRKSVAASETA